MRYSFDTAELDKTLRAAPSVQLGADLIRDSSQYLNILVLTTTITHKMNLFVFFMHKNVPEKSISVIQLIPCISVKYSIKNIYFKGFFVLCGPLMRRAKRLIDFTPCVSRCVQVPNPECQIVIYHRTKFLIGARGG